MSSVKRKRGGPRTHQEFLWTLGRVEEDGTTSIMYRFVTNSRDCYTVVVDEEVYGTGYTGKQLAAMGWKPVRVLVQGDFQC